MIIGYLTSQYPATSHTFIAREIKALRGRGFDIRTFSVRKPAENERAAQQERTEYEGTWYILPARKDFLAAHTLALVKQPGVYFRTLRDSIRHRVPGLEPFLMSFIYFGEAIYLSSELKHQQVTHLHNHFGNPSATVGYLASRFLGITWSLTLHGHSDCDYPTSLLLPEKIAHASFVPCVAHFTKSQAMCRVAPALWPKLFINRCGVELDKYMLKKPERPSGYNTRILSVARLSPEKGLTGLVQAFSILIEAGVDAELRIIGEGDDRERIEATIHSLNLEQRCTLPGRASESAVLGELAQADIFVLSSFMEGLPVAIMEALALGIPVIAPNVGGVAELIEDKASGLLFSPGNWVQLAGRLQALVGDAKLRQQIAQEGQRRVKAEFDMRTVINPIVERFRALPSGPNNRTENHPQIQ